MLHRPTPAATFGLVSLFSVSVLSPLARAQDKAKIENAMAMPAGAPKDPLLTGLPPFLKPVPGGPTTIGVTSEQLLRAIFEAVSPTNPNSAPKTSVTQIVKALKNTASELGQTKEQVDTFLLGTWPVKNSEWLVYVQKKAALKTPVRPPYHWWRFGRKDDYEQRLPEINKEFPDDRALAPILYWERHGTELPYKLVDENGKPIDDLPVVFVDHRDAVRFAGWLGMRLPTEAERTRAVRGDSAQVWPWGGNKALGDAYSEKALELLRLKGMRDQVLKPVGTVEFAYGPYGHWDMVGQVWEMVAKTSFKPIGELAKFESEWKLLMKDKVGAQMQNPPAWTEHVAIVKGGSFMSSKDPIELHIDSRARIKPDEALDYVGLRLAKCFRPGYDVMVSWTSGGFDQGLFATEQAIDLKAQIGVERYVLAENGFPDEYHAFSFVPLNGLTNEKNASLAKIEERSQLTPVAIGILGVTEKVLAPALNPGVLYAVAYRKEGVPKDLEEALKVGVKEVQAAQKRKDRGEKEEQPESGDKKPKGSDWHPVLTKYGLTEKDLVNGAPKFIRVNGYELPTDASLFVFVDTNGKDPGKIVTHIATTTGLATGSQAASELVFDGRKGKDGERAHVGLKGCLPLQIGQKRMVSFTIDFTLDCPPPSDAAPWRMPGK